MKKYLFEIVFYFFVPVILIAVIAEYSIRQIPNDYSFKKEWLEKNSKDLEVLCLGPSTIFYGINPNYFHNKAFNASHLAESLNYDYFIFNKFYNQMDSLHYLVLGFDMLSPFTIVEDSPEWWRVKYYSIYYDCDYHKAEPKYNYEMYFHNFTAFKYAAQGMLNVIGLKNFSHITTNERGYGVQFVHQNKGEGWDNGYLLAQQHNSLMEHAPEFNHEEEIRNYVDEICRKSQEKGIQVVFVSPPVYETYYRNLKPEYVKQRDDFCNSYAQKYSNVRYVDFSRNAHFVDEDFFDSNHLSDLGAEKFTKLLDHALMEIENEKMKAG